MFDYLITNLVVYGSFKVGSDRLVGFFILDMTIPPFPTPPTPPTPPIILNMGGVEAKFHWLPNL
jgi:hypothetical protein